MLEAGQHESSIFGTFTYDEQHLPRDGCVSVLETRLLLERIRRRVGKFRYYIVGEYGDRSWRPHYHALLFGVRDGRAVSEAWQKGFVHLSGVGVESAAYVAGYCLKGLNTERGMRWKSKKLLPEFSRMSLKPGIGAVAGDQIGAFYSSDVGSRALLRSGVSSVVRQNKKMWPLGRYLRSRAIAVAGVDPEGLSARRQLENGSLLKGMDQDQLHKHVESVLGVAARSGYAAEARFKRMSLERKI